jgi:hypothetical protein
MLKEAPWTWDPWRLLLAPQRQEAPKCLSTDPRRKNAAGINISRMKQAYDELDIGRRSFLELVL